MTTQTELATIGNINNQYCPISGGILNFTVKTENNADISLSEGPDYSDQMYMILIGNHETQVHRKPLTAVAVKETTGILNKSEARGFWIRWNSGSVVVGKKGEPQPFISFINSLPFHVTHYGIRSQQRANWVIEDCWTFDTNGNQDYVFRPIMCGQLNVAVSAPNDGHVALASGPSDASVKYEIYIGGWKNTTSVIRYKKIETSAKIQQTENLDQDKFMMLTISWKNGKFLIFHEGNEIYQWTDTQPSHLTHFIIWSGRSETGTLTTWGKGKAIDLSTLDKLASLHFPISGGSPHLGTLKRDALLEDFSDIDDTYEKVTDELSDLVFEDELKKFVITWKNGTLKVFNETDRILKSIDTQPYNIKYFCISSEWSSSGRVQVSSLFGNYKALDILSPDNLTYNYYPITEGIVHFTVKARNDAHVCLLCDNKGSKFLIEAAIGKNMNTFAELRKRNKSDENLETGYIYQYPIQRPNLVSENEARGFWIKWYGGSVTVGRKGELQSFLSCEIPEPLHVTHFGTRTGWGATGEWVIEDHLQFKTNDDKTYVYHPITWGQLNVAISASRKAHIALASEIGETLKYEILIGDWKNTAPTSVIRHNGGEPDKVYEVNNVSWMENDANKIPTQASTSNKYDDGGMIFIGRDTHEVQTAIRKLQGIHQAGYIPHYSEKNTYPEYEILAVEK